MARMTGGEALVKQLYHEGIRVVFGLPASSSTERWPRSATEPRIRFIQTRHEQATSYMADGYARARRRCRHRAGGAGTRPPQRRRRTQHRVLRLLARLHDLRPGAEESDRQGHRRAPRGQRPARVASGPSPSGGAACWRWREVPAAVRAAMHQLTTGRPRPVEIEMPPETMEEEGEAVLHRPGAPGASRRRRGAT